MHRVSLSLLVILSLWISGAASAAELYVSPSGSDSAAGTERAPFRTITRARDAARQLAKPATVYLRGGKYVLDEPVVFGVQDGGVTYQAYHDETPVFTSAVPARGWEKVTTLPEGAASEADGHLWATEIPEGVKDFKVMFDGNRMLERARSRGFQSPQQEFKKFATRNVALPEDRPLLRRLEFPLGEIKAWDNIEDVEAFFCGVPWTHNISSIESVDLQNRIAWLKYEGNTPPFTTPKPYNPAYLENVVDILDQPGEWCVNTKTRRIYYWPVNGEPSDAIVVPRLVEYFRVEGDIDYDGPTDAPVKGLVFRGLTFTQADRYSWWEDHKGWGIQHDWDKFDHGNALLRFRGAEDCTVESCRFVSSGNSAIRLDLHAQNITIRNNLIDRVGHMGILLCGYGPGTKDVNKHNRIVNNLIRRTGELIWHGHAIFVWQSGENVIANNHIREVPRKAIGICGVRGAIFMEGKRVDWDEASKTIRWHELECEIFEEDGTLQSRLLPFLHARSNMVENNYVYRARTKIGDGAAMNVSGAGTGNVMRRNMLSVSLGNGFRCDDWQRGATFAENLILSGGLVHKGHNHVINNVFINSNIRFSLYPGQQPNPGSQIHNNVFYFTRAGIVPYTGRQSPTIQTPESCDLRSNVYFSEVDGEALQRFLAASQAKGMDRGSRVADPVFVRKIDLRTELHPADLEWASDSPARQMGFKPVDASRIGLTSDYPEDLLGEVFPSKRGRCVSETAVVSSSGKRKLGDPQQIVKPGRDRSLACVYESEEEEAPSVTLTLDGEYPICGLEIVADFKDRQNAMRLLTVWSSLDGKQWSEIWRADPYHIAMGRDWLVKPYQVVPAKFVKVGLRPKSELPFQLEDERAETGPYRLRLNRVQVFSTGD